MNLVSSVKLDAEYFKRVEAIEFAVNMMMAVIQEEF